jgi:hypothetical protein
MKQHGKDMKKLVKYMEDNGYKYEDDFDMSTVYFSKVVNNKHCVFALTEPHSGNKHRWLLRAEDVDYFDRWSNASYEAYYDTVEEFINHVLIDLEEKWN